MLHSASTENIYNLPQTFGEDWLLLMQLFTQIPGPCTKWEEKHWAANWTVIKKPEFKNQKKLLRNNHGKRSIVCKIFISSIKEEGLHHLSRELPISIKQDGSSYTHIFGEEGKEGEGEQTALPQTATIDKLLKTGYILHSFRNQKEENKANSQLTC